MGANKDTLKKLQKMVKSRMVNHRGYMSSGETSTPTGAHCSSWGLSLYDMKVTIVEQVKKTDDIYHKVREKYHIERFKHKTRVSKKISKKGKFAKGLYTHCLCLFKYISEYSHSAM